MIVIVIYIILIAGNRLLFVFLLKKTKKTKAFVKENSWFTPYMYPDLLTAYCFSNYVFLRDIIVIRIGKNY